MITAAQQIAERLAFRIDPYIASRYREQVRESLANGMQEGLDHIELARHGCLKGGAVELHLDIALAKLKGEKA